MLTQAWLGDKCFHSTSTELPLSFFPILFSFFKCEYEDLYVRFPIRIKVGVFSRKKKNLNFGTSNFGSNLALRICV